MTAKPNTSESVTLTFPAIGAHAQSTVVAALFDSLITALQIPVPESIDDHPAYERLLGTFVLDAVSTFYLNLKPAPLHAALPLRHLTIALNDLSRGIPNPIFDKPPGTSTPPDPTMLWLLRAESAALLKILIDKNYEGPSKAADRIFRKIGPSLLSRLTKRPFTSRPRIFIDWLDKFQEAVVAEEKAKKRLIPTIPTATGYEEASFADQNFIAFARFKNHVANLSADWDKTDTRERLVWINRRLATLADKFEKFQL